MVKKNMPIIVGRKPGLNLVLKYMGMVFVRFD